MSKPSYQDKLRMQVRQWQDKIDQLSAHMKQASAETRRQFSYQIEDLQAKQKAARRKLEQIEQTGRNPGMGEKARVAAARKVNRAVKRIVSGLR